MTFSCGTDGRDEVDAIIIRPQRDDVDVRGGWTEWYVWSMASLDVSFLPLNIALAR